MRKTDFGEIIGKKFGKLTILGEASVRSKGNRIMAHCICDCGIEKDVTLKSIMNGKSTSCGCYKIERSSEKYCIDETGNRYGNIVVLGRHGKAKDGKATWDCKCELCGNEFVALGKSLRNSNQTACAACAHKIGGEHLRKLSIGDKIGMLTILGVNDEKKGAAGQLFYDCICDCGNTKTIWGSAIRNGLTTSCGCYQSSMEHRIILSAALQGVSLDDWQGFTPKRKQNVYKGTDEYRQWEKSVYKRDNYTCVKCGAVKGDANIRLVVHHLDSYTDFPDKRIDIDNGITLCNKCHGTRFKNSFHWTYGTHHNRKWQFEKWLSESKMKRQVWGNSRAVVQLSKDGMFIKSFSSIREASHSLHPNNQSASINAESSISAVCRARKKSAYGFTWKYLSDYQNSTYLEVSHG